MNTIIRFHLVGRRGHWIARISHSSEEEFRELFANLLRVTFDEPLEAAVIDARQSSGDSWSLITIA